MSIENSDWLAICFNSQKSLNESLLVIIISAFYLPPAYFNEPNPNNDINKSLLSTIMVLVIPAWNMQCVGLS